MTFPTFEGLREVEALMYIGVFIGVLLVFTGLQELLGGRSAERTERNRRMRMIRKGIDEQEIFATLAGTRRPDSPGARGPIAHVRRNLRRAGLPIGVSAVVLGSVALGAGSYAGLSLMVPMPAAIAIAAGIGLLVPYAIVDALASERTRKFTTQLPDALDMMARGLKIGHPLNVTLKRVAEQMPDPIGTEFGLIEDRIRHGADIDQAFAEFAARFDTEDAQYLAACVGIQHGTGGNLGRILKVLSRVIRDRMNMRLKIRAVSGEGRLSAFILSLMPFLITGAIHSTTPSYYTDVMDHPVFMPAAATVVGLVILQALILRRLATFDF